MIFFLLANPEQIRPPLMIDPAIVEHIHERHEIAVSELRDNEG